jgi:hypothetical protein
MPNSRNKRIIFTAAFVAAGIGAGWWLLVDAPEQGSEPEAMLPRPVSPGLSTGYKPPALPSNSQPGGPVRPMLERMLAVSTPLAERIEILDGLTPDLTETETLALLHELFIIPRDERVSAWHSTYIHKICNLLQRVVSSHDAFSHALAAVAANRDLPVVYRDYAFQHLRILWHRSDNDVSSAAGQARASAIEETFRNLLDERPETAAQSLLGLHEIRHPSGTPAVPDEEITLLLTGILDSPPAADSVASRMTAVRILAERRIPGNSRVLRGIATSEAEHSLVRASAIAALGFIADPADLEFLDSLHSDNPVLAAALRHAGNSE